MKNKEKEVITRKELIDIIDRINDRLNHEEYEGSWGEYRTLYRDVEESPSIILDLLKEELEK